MRAYFMHDPSEAVFAVDNFSEADRPTDMDVEEISLSLYNRLVLEGWACEVVAGTDGNIEAQDDKVMQTVQEFLDDQEAWDLYITGPAGTGKTYKSADIIRLANKLEIPVMACAFTHKACGVLASKLPAGTRVETLHKFLAKRPTINIHAMQAEHITKSKVQGKGLSSEVKLLIIDEYGMVGEKDLADIRTAQDPEYKGEPLFKVVWLGDPNQLPPVGDIQAVQPRGAYQIRLTEIRRTDKLPLLDTLATLVDYIEETKPPAALKEHEFFVRGKDILTEKGDIILAYTNKRVQEINELKQGYSLPKPGDKLFSPTTHKEYVFVDSIACPDAIDTPINGKLEIGSKYQTLEFLHERYDFAVLEDEDGNEVVMPYVFGHYNYNVTSAQLKEQAASSNRVIEEKYRGYKAAQWAKANNTHKLARARAKAWREFLSFDDCVCCLDFDHARTVHKAQGSTFNTVLIDTNDLYICAERNFKMYLRLLYVAISRASHMVITN